MITGSKEIRIAGLKVSPTTPNAEQLAKINRFTRRPYEAEELYIGQLRLANNAIDRDVERFSEDILKGFAKTAVRKTMLLDHRTSVKSAIGKFFDVELEKVPIGQYVEETGEEVALPEGMKDVLIVSPWFYIPKAAADPRDLEKIDAGIYDYASIGFTAENRVAVNDDEGQTLYREYRGRGETREGSLVYLGAQYGAAVKTPGKEATEDHEKEEKKAMEFLKKVSQALGKVFSTEDEAISAVGGMKADLDRAEARVKELEPLEEEVKTLKPLADIGKKHRDGLIDTFVKLKAKLGEVTEDKEAQDRVKAVAQGFGIEYLEAEVASLEKRVEDKFPGSQLDGGDPDSHRDKTGSENSLVEDAKKRAEAHKK